MPVARGRYGRVRAVGVAVKMISCAGKLMTLRGERANSLHFRSLMRVCITDCFTDSISAPAAATVPLPHT
jgi:hypothetical protein